MQFRKHDYHIAEHYLSALINGDITGLEPGEDLELDLFVAEVQQGHGSDGHWACGSDDAADFRLCEVSGLMAMCQTISYMQPIR